MANPFMTGRVDHDEIDTAIIWENATITDIGNAVAYTDGTRLYVNTDENLEKILPHYTQDFLKWVLWHEKYHIELKHHNRFFKYLSELKEKDIMDKFQVTKDEVNIIMDILVHDSLSKMFPELVNIALENLAQFRNRNSLGYTFKTHNLEDMLDEYSKYKHGEDKDDGGKGMPGKSDEETEETEETEDDKTTHKKSHEDSKGKTDRPDKRKDKAEDGEPKIDDTAERPDAGPEDEHDKTDWSKLDDLDSKEFITEEEADAIDEYVNKLKKKKIKLGRLTHTLNGLATTKRDRTYRLPSMLQTGDGCIFKGKTPGRVELYFVFDASGSMGSEMQLFKEIITKSIPQAMKCPCEWFAGDDSPIPAYKTEHCDGYYKGTYKDFMPVWASSGYSDDGDRTIELCWQAEQQGYTPIGITDGGGTISWSKDKLKQLKRTILVGPNSWWLAKAKEINPAIQTLSV